MARKIPGVTSSRTRLTDGGREPDDWYITPPAVTQLLLDHEKFDGSVWEPACGTGEMSEVIKANGYGVWSTDLISRGYEDEVLDFLSYRKDDEDIRGYPCDNIITNPPFKLATEFALHSIDIAPFKLALLQRVPWLEGGERHDKLFSVCPPSRVLIFSDRHTLWRGDTPPEKRIDKGGVMALAWYVWDDPHGIRARKRKKPPEVHWLRG